MTMPMGVRWTLAALLAAALLVGAGGVASADETPETAEEETSVVETNAGGQKMRIFVTTKDGVRTVKVMREKDGEWVVVGDGAEGASGTHVSTDGGRTWVPQDGTRPSGVRVRFADGASLWVDPEDLPLGLVREEGAPAPKPEAATESPLPTILRWLFEDAAKEKDPLEAWFEAGDDVPLARLRNALKRDGWTPDRLRTWMYEMASTHVEALLRQHARGPHARGGGYERHPPMHGSHPPHMRRGPAPRGAWPRHAGPGATRVHAHSSAYVVWRDAEGNWHHQALPAGERGGGSGTCPHAPCPHHAPPVPPTPPIPPTPPVPPTPPAPSAAPTPPMPPGLEDMLERLEGLPPEAREAIRRMLQSGPGFGMGAAGGGGAGAGTPPAPDLGALLQAFQSLDPETRQALMRQMVQIGAAMFGGEGPVHPAPEPPEEEAPSPSGR